MTVDAAVRQALADNYILQFMERYAPDPVGFVREVLGVEPDPWQAELLQAIVDGERRISVRSGHGVGKSAVLSWACVWAVSTHDMVKVVVTAPSGPQLWDALFAEIKLWMNLLPAGLSDLFSIGTDRIESKAAPERVFISARTSRAETPEAMQGVHAEGGRVILIADEASGIPEPVFEAGAGSMSGKNCTTLLAGNPTRTSGLFFDTHNRLKDSWYTIHVSCLTVARVDPDFVEDMKQRYGEESNAYRVRVLGEFPLSDEDTLIPLDIVQAAMERDIADDENAPVVWGLDVARFGSDKSCLVKRRGRVMFEPPRHWRGLDLMQLTGAVKAEWDATPVKERPVEINVDVIGLGAGVVDRLRELKLPVNGINVGESPSFAGDGKYYNLRAELWDRGKAWLLARNCKLPRVESLYELAVPRYSFTSNGRLKVESKDDMRKRGVRSPDTADAFLLTLASDASVIVSGRSYSSNWAKPLRRNLKGVV